VFGAYCDLVFAIEADRRDLVKALLAEIAAAPNRPADLAICDLADPTCDPIAERYVRLINTDPSASFNVLPLTRLRGLEWFLIGRPLLINGLSGKVFTTAGDWVGVRLRCAVAAEAAN
jgi:hypothetical protein